MTLTANEIVKFKSSTIVETIFLCNDSVRNKRVAGCSGIRKLDAHIFDLFNIVQV